MQIASCRQNLEPGRVATHSLDSGGGGGGHHFRISNEMATATNMVKDFLPYTHFNQMVLLGSSTKTMQAITMPILNHTYVS